MDSLLILIFKIARFLPLLGSIGQIVLGILILTAKPKSTKIFGIGIIVSSLGGMMTFARSGALMAGSVEMYSKVITGTSIVSFCVAFISVLCMCIFIHKNYGKKLIYIPLLIIEVLAPLASTLVRVLLLKAVGVGFESLQAWILMTGTINSLVTAVASSLILILIFRKHRDSEKVIPHYWIILTINLIYKVITSLILIIFSLQLLRDPSLISDLTNINDLIMLSGYLFGLISPIYICVMAFKAGARLPQGENTAV